MNIPNFIGIGSRRSSTTWLYECLRVHPDICMSLHKELHFFSYNYLNGKSWYINQFSHCKNGKVIGEFSTSYLDSPHVAERIYRDFPWVKILVILRNPIHQAFSYYKYLKRYNQIDSESPREAFEKYPAIIAQAKYYNFLLPYRNRFTRRNVYIMLFEKLHTEPVVELSRLYQFLEVDSSFVPYAAKKVVSKGINARIKQLEKVRASLFFFLKEHNKSSLINFIRRTRIPELYRKLNDRGTSSIELDVPTKMYLHDIFKDVNEELSRLIEMDLSIWSEY